MLHNVVEAPLTNYTVCSVSQLRSHKNWSGWKCKPLWLVGLSPMSDSDSDGNVGSKELAVAADVILVTHKNQEVPLLLFELSRDTLIEISN